MLNDLTTFVTDVQSQIDNGDVELVTPTETTTYTPYAIWVLLNETFLQLGIDKMKYPQEVYQMAKNGTIDGVKYPTGYDFKTNGFTEEKVVDFIKKMVTRRMKKTNK